MKRAGYVSALLFLSLWTSSLAFASVTGSISGTVSDVTGALMPGATVEATETLTGVKHTVITDAQGFYSFLALPVGTYNVEVTKTGFRNFLKTNLAVNANDQLRTDAILQVGGVQQEVTITANPVQVETTNTQLGEVIQAQKMTTLPLDGRAYTDLLALQPGVVPTSSGVYGATAPSGNLNPGNLSVNGNREVSNGFMVNGGNVNEGVFQTAAVIPNLDSLEQFRILTSNFDAEYGNYSGGQINAVTKSGTNQYHGDLFEFLRNDALDANDFFFNANGAKRGSFKQNQFGGTAGGPIVHDKVFFFADYQGTRHTIGASSTTIVPSLADRGGNLADQASALTSTVRTCAVPGVCLADVLSASLNYSVVPGEPYYYLAGQTNPATGLPYPTNCISNNTTTGCVFPNAVIPQTAWSPVASALLKYIPQPNTTLQTSTGPVPAFIAAGDNDHLRDDKTSFRVDANTHLGTISGYYFFDDYNDLCPFCSASFPGFETTNVGRSQMANIADIATFGSTAVNEFRVHFMRFANFLGKPKGGVGSTLQSLGFQVGSGTLGIVPLAPAIEGVPNLSTNNFTIGVNAYPLEQYNNTYQVLDNYSKVIGTHSLKFGANAHYDWVTQHPHGANNGSIGISGTETGLDFADFLLGAVNSYNQGEQEALYSRGKYFGLYGQDSWRATQALTFNYGLRWDVSTPWYEARNELETMVPGLQSVVFPTAPLGWVVPGDPGIPKTLAPTRYNNFAPRIGLAYSPGASSGFLHALFGDSGQSSLRAGDGIFYTAIEDQTNALEVGDPPFGLFYVNPSPDFLQQPFLALDGTNEMQRFPVPLPPLNVSASHPDPNINWAQYEPISSSPGYYPGNRLPYSENYNVSFQRQLGPNTVMGIAYVGSQGHRLLVDLEANPSDPALCLAAGPGLVAPNTSACGPFAENGSFTLSNGTVVVPRHPFGALIGSNGWYDNMGNSNYNSLQASARHHAGRLEVMGSYTYSKVTDESSGLGEQVSVTNFKLSKSLAAFDMTHNFVASYQYELPFERFLGNNQATRGWILSGITRFTTGLPITIMENDDAALLGTNSTGPNGNGVDQPNFTPGPLNFTDPRTQQPYFNTNLFFQEGCPLTAAYAGSAGCPSSVRQLGLLGNSSRRFFHGPGFNNFDLALLKNFRIAEGKSLELRGEFFNAFNHVQFSNPDGTINHSSFGVVSSDSGPRIGQLGLKFIF